MLAISVCISKMKTFPQTYPVEISQNVFVVLALPGQEPWFPNGFAKIMKVIRNEAVGML
jgi:hypothetical protein